MTEKDYPAYYEHLKALMKSLAKEAPGPMSGFAQLHQQAMGAGALSVKVKELIALGISIQTRCEGCIAFHVRGPLHAGATRQEVLETINVALMMGGGPSSIYAAEAFEALEQFEKANAR